MLRKLLLAGSLAAVLPLSAAFATDRPVVVELFTSQGCSSCPPANAFLSELAKGRRDVLPLGVHVTYWDRLGWKDPFSLRAATARQALYGARFGDGSYTPEMVVDGPWASSARTAPRSMRPSRQRRAGWRPTSGFPAARRGC
ncbi:MAG: DUF1223 domain-containing protein [Amaricoccus sp.]